MGLDRNSVDGRDIAPKSVDTEQGTHRHLYPIDQGQGSVINALDYLEDGDASDIGDAVNQAFTDLTANAPERGVVVVPRKPDGNAYDPSTSITIPRYDNLALIGLGALFSSQSLSKEWITSEAWDGSTKPDGLVIRGFTLTGNRVTVDGPLVHLKDWATADIRGKFQNADPHPAIKISSPNSTTANVSVKSGSKFYNNDPAIQFGDSSDPTGTNNNVVERGVQIDNPTGENTGIIVENGFRNNLYAHIENAHTGWDIYTANNIIGGHFDRQNDATFTLRVRNKVPITVYLPHGVGTFVDKMELAGYLRHVQIVDDDEFQGQFRKFIETEGPVAPSATKWSFSGTGSESRHVSGRLLLQSGSSSSDERVADLPGRIGNLSEGQVGIDFIRAAFTGSDDTTNSRARVGLYNDADNYAVFEADPGSSSTTWKAVVNNNGTLSSTDMGVAADTTFRDMLIRGEPSRSQYRFIIGQPNADGSQVTVDGSSVGGNARPYVAVQTNEAAAKQFWWAETVARGRSG